MVIIQFFQVAKQLHQQVEEEVVMVVHLKQLVVLEVLVGEQIQIVVQAQREIHHL
tara:strand:- start:204 stop:368 length:165 start_codon:yes stop_codon:yes gene_type:complete